MTVFVTKGDEALTDAQLSKRTQKYIDIDWPQWKRERSVRLNDDLFNSYMTTVSADTDTNRANNTFNQQLADYRVATARLSQYRLADGRDEVTEDIGTGEFDDDGNEIMETVIVQTAIDPLPGQVEETTYDEDGNATTAMVDNPLIVQDDEERSAAQVIIDSTPQEVKDF